MQELHLTSNIEIMKLINRIFEILTTENIFISKKEHAIELQKSYKNYIPNPITNLQNIQKQNNMSIQSNIKKIVSESFKDVALECFEYKLSLTKESVDNPKPLSPKTLQGYNDCINTQIIPYFKNNKNISNLQIKILKIVLCLLMVIVIKSLFI